MAGEDEIGKYVSGAQLMGLCHFQQRDLMQFVRDGLKAFEPKSLAPYWVLIEKEKHLYDLIMNSEGVEPGLLEDIEDLYPILPEALFLRSDIEERDIDISAIPTPLISPSRQHTSDLQRERPIADSQSAPPETIKQFLRDAGKKGGARSKICKPILGAITDYLKEHSKTHKMTNEGIARQFTRKYNNDNNAMVVVIGEIKWAIFYSGERIFLRVEESYSKNPTNVGKSIAYTTFKNVYIPLAKKSIPPDITL